MLEFLSQYRGELLITIVCGTIVGIILNYFYYLISRKEPLPAYQFHSRRLIGKEEQELPKEVEILFNSQPISKLTLSRFYFWNSGTATILGKDIVPTDPIRLEIEDGIILKSRIVKATRKVNNFLVQLNSPKQAIIKFYYLDPGDGAVIEILHTSQQCDPKLLGTIIGIKKILSWGPYQDVSTKIRTKYFLDAILTVGPIITLIIIGMISMALDLLENRNITFKLVIFIISILTGILLGMKIKFLRRRFPKLLQVEE